MTDLLLTIASIGLYIPFFVQLFRTHWTKENWSRQAVVLAVALELTTLLHIPAVMYCGVIVLLLAVLAYCIHTRPSFRLTPLLVLSGLYMASFAVSLSWSALPARGARFILDNGFPLLGFAVVAGVIRIDTEELQSVLKTFCYAAGIFIVLAVISWGISCAELGIAPWHWPILQKVHVGTEDAFKWIYRFNGGMNGYTHPSYNILPLFAAACAGMRLSMKGEIHPSIGWLIGCGCLLLTLLTQSRMGILYSMIVFAAGITYLSSRPRNRLITSCGLMVIMMIGFFATRSEWQSYTNDPIRDELNAHTWHYIQAKPWTGAGAGALTPIEICHTIHVQYWPHVGYISPDEDIHNWEWKAHMLPHNQWMADWAHAGIAAALITLLLYVYMGIMCFRRRSYWGIVFFLIFCIFSCLEPPLYIGKGLYLFCISAFLLQSYAEGKQ